MAIEDREDLDRAPVADDPVGGHGVELGSLAALDQVLAFTEDETGGALEDVEPVSSRVHAGVGLPFGCRDAHLCDDSSGRVLLAGEWPMNSPIAIFGAGGANDDFVFVVAADDLVDRGLQGPGKIGELVDGQAPVPGLEAADSGCTDVGSAGQLVQTPASAQAKAAEPSSSDVLEARRRCVLLHWQDSMPITRRVPTLDGMDPDRHNHVHLDEADWQAWAGHAELEGEVLLAFVTETAAKVQALRGPDAQPVRRVLDIGSGPGVGTCELARIFPDAELTAVDSSPAMLERVTRRASALGLSGRVRTRLADLPGGIADLGPSEVIWASLSLHHVGDQVAALLALRAVLAPDGLLAIAEFGDPMRVLPDGLDVGQPGLGERLDRAGATWFAAMRDGLPGSAPSADLPSMLNRAGLEVVVAHHAIERFDAPISANARQLALGYLRRSRGQLTPYLDEDDLATLDVLTDPDDPRSLRHRPDVFIAASRQIVIARPAGAR